MPRRVEDIVRVERRAASSEAPLKPPARPTRQKPTRITPPPEEPVRRSKRSSGNKKIGLGIFAAVVILVTAAAMLATTKFSRATFTLVPIVSPVSVNGTTIVATGTSTPGYVKYEITKYSGAASTTVPATDGVSASTKASGTITVFNSYNKEGQRLIAGTRFAGNNGLVYRLTSSIFVPGYSGNASTPGSIKAAVVADQAGAQYNASANDAGTMMRIVAYKGGPRYESIYGKSYTGMSGGFSGTKKTVEKKLLASTTEEVRKALTNSLLDQARTKIPEGYVTYPAAYGVSFAPTDVGGSEPKQAVITVSGTLYSVMFKKTELAAALAGKNTIERFGKSPYSIIGIEDLSFSISNPSTFSPSKFNTLIAKLSGNIILKGIVPVSEIVEKLAGMPLSETRQVFSSYGSVIDVSKSSGELFPSWASSVPNDVERIKIKVEEPS